MQFFERARRSQFKTRRLVFFFTLLYLGLSLLLGALIAGLSGFFYHDFNSFYFESSVIAGITYLFMTMLTYSKYLQLKVGSDYVLNQLNAIPIDEFHKNPIVRRYYQVASEMAIAANMKLPRTYILPTTEINALAVASSDEDVAIAVTEGALTKLSREELQGIVAHEMSHIYHRDCILNFNLVSWLYGLQSTYLYGRDLFNQLVGTYPRKLDEICLGYTQPFYREKQNVTFLGFVPLIIASGIMLVGFGGAVIARMIKASITREREYLADAEAVRLTRSKALANVLKKIAMLIPDEEMEHYRSKSIYQEFTHFYLNDYSMDEVKTSWFDTHPPVLSRIKAIDPSFKAPSMEELEAMGMTLSYDNFNPMSDDEQSALVQYASNQTMRSSRDSYLTLGIDSSNRTLINSLAIFYAVTLTSNKNPEILAKQKEILKKSVSDAIFDQVESVYNTQISVLDEYEKVQFYINNTPALGSLLDEDFERFQRTLKELILVDRKLSLYEYCIWKYVEYINERDRQSAGEGLSFTQPQKVIIDMPEDVATFFNILLLKAFTEQGYAKEIYDSIVADFAPSIRFRTEIAWYKALEEILPNLKEITIAGADYMAEKMEIIYKDPFATNNGKTLVHIFCLILKYRLPDVLRYQESDKNQRVNRINLYR